MFSGTDQLIESFFVEISAQLKLNPKFASVGKILEDYGEIFSGMAWLPLIGPWIERGRGATKILNGIIQRRKEGISDRRTRVEEALSDLDKPIIVVVDDIDRLTTAEIRSVFRLVRLTANFRNVIYILAFDRVRVEEALAEQGISGRAYLEKILQVGFDLPVVPAQALNRQVFEAIDKALSEINNRGPFDQNAWPDIFMEVIRPLVSTMRDVRRYAMAIAGTVRELDGQIALTDVLALEAIRIFLPDLFHKIHESVDGLTTTSENVPAGLAEPTHLKEQFDLLIEAGKAQEKVTAALIRRLFPAARRHIIGDPNYGSEWKNRWLQARRVAHEGILRLYLERVIGERLESFTHAERAWSLMADRPALDGFLHGLDPKLLTDVISNLEAYEEEFAPEHVVPGSIVLLNILPKLPARQRSMLEVPPRMVVVRVVYRLLRSLDNPNSVETAVRQVLPELTTLWGKLELITIVGHQEGAGHKLVPESTADLLEKNWRAEVRSTSTSNLVGESELLRILFRAKLDEGPEEPPLEIPDSPQLTLELLLSARHEEMSQGMESRAVHRSQRLLWDELIKVYGDEVTLCGRIEDLKVIQLESIVEGVEDLLQLAEKYCSGWRPGDFADDEE